MKVIQTVNLTKYYGKVRGIEDINLEVEEGDIFGFIGPNGAGKSTTIRTLLNYLYPSRGSARVMGLDIIKDSLNIRRDTGYIPSEVNYYADLTVLQLLRYSASFYGRGAGSRITALADRFDLNLNRRIEELSYGNKRKVAIVQALIHSPRLLVLDEPTSGLDPLMQNEFFEVLKEENRRATIFFSSHVLYEVQRMCNKIAIIKQGEILKVESVDSLRKSTFKTVSIEYENINEPVLQMQGLVPAGQSGHLQKFLFNGDIKKLLYELSQKDIKNVLIEEPSLEEIFMHYYEREVE